MFAMRWGSMDRGNLRMLNNDKETKAFSASRMLELEDKTYVANDARDTWVCWRSFACCIIVLSDQKVIVLSCHQVNGFIKSLLWRKVHQRTIENIYCYINKWFWSSSYDVSLKTTQVHTKHSNQTKHNKWEWSSNKETRKLIPKQTKQFKPWMENNSRGRRK